MYKSLKELYSEQVSNKQIPVPSRRSVNGNEPLIPVETTSKLELKVSQNFLNIESTPDSSLAWTPYQKSIFSLKKTGAGRGEYSVASFVTGLEPAQNIDQQIVAQQLERCVSGQNQKFDVTVPPLDVKNIQDRKVFEVKELDKDGKSVRIGAEGRVATNIIARGVEHILVDLDNIYKSLDNNSKLQVDELLRKQLKISEDIQEPPPPKSGIQTPAYLSSLERYRAAAEIAETWNLKGYIDAIFETGDEEGRSIRELPAALIKPGSTINRNNYWQNPERFKYFSRTLEQVFNAIEDLAKSQEEFAFSVPSKSEELKTLIRKLYLPDIKDSEAAQKELEFLDSEADIIDRKLTRRKCSSTGSACLDAKGFFNSVNRMRLLSRLRGIQSKLTDPNIIKKLFPPNFTGLFLVNSNGFSYYPRESVDQYIEIDQLSAGGVKITRRKNETV